MKIVFVGTPKFASNILKGLMKKHKPVLVITSPDKPVGRKKILAPSQVKVIAEENDIPVVQPEKIEEYQEDLKRLNPDLIILTAYGQIISKELLNIPKYGSINIHPSLLPKYRGASPIQTAILNGNEETGVTIYQMDEKIDHGEILSQIKYSIDKKVNYEELEKELSKVGLNLLLKTLPDIFEEKTKPQKQIDSDATYTKIMKKEDGNIDWNKSAQEIERQIRAFSVWPGSFTHWKKHDKKLQIKILSADIEESKGIPGKVFPELVVGCGTSSLAIKELQLEGKNETNSEDFLKGNSDIIGTTLEK